MGNYNCRWTVGGGSGVCVLVGRGVGVGVLGGVAVGVSVGSGVSVGWICVAVAVVSPVSFVPEVGVPPQAAISGITNDRRIESRFILKPPLRSMAA